MSLILFPVVIAVVGVIAVLAVVTSVLDRGVSRHESGKGP
jgi:hypothetical protein